MNNYFGYHLMLDCSGCSRIGFEDREHIYNWIKELVPTIEMEASGEPIIEYLLPGDPKQGYSLMQLITTSNICAHFLDLNGTVYFDIFSCKEFDCAVAKRLVEKYFSPTKIRVNFITRDAS